MVIGSCKKQQVHEALLPHELLIQQTDTTRNNLLDVHGIMKTSTMQQMLFDCMARNFERFSTLEVYKTVGAQEDQSRLEFKSLVRT